MVHLVDDLAVPVTLVQGLPRGDDGLCGLELLGRGNVLISSVSAPEVVLVEALGGLVSGFGACFQNTIHNYYR